MSKYTMELRYLLAAGYTPSLAEYPIFDEAYRPILNKKILEHYNFYEIGQETPDRFDWYLRITMNEIMPYFNKLYYSETLTFNPLYNFNMTETTDRKSNGVSIGISTGNDAMTNNLVRGEANALMAESDTPGANLDVSDIKDGMYASKVTHSKQETVTDATNATTTTNSKNVGEGSNTEIFVRNVSGVSAGDQSELMMNYRRSLINIDLQIIEALSVLFMGVW